MIFLYPEKKKYHEMHDRTKLIIRNIEIQPKQEFGGQCENMRVLKCEAEQDSKHRAQLLENRDLSSVVEE